MQVCGEQLHCRCLDRVPELGVGQHGYDCMNLIKCSYVNTSNVTALLFFIQPSYSHNRF